jgi:hypothetical protein
MVMNTPSKSRPARRLPPLPPRSRLDKRYLGISGRYWVITGIVLGLCLSIYEVSNPVSPNAFDQPGAQIPNQLRSPWGVKNPL